MDKTAELAEKIYIAVYGNNDSKGLHAQKVGEIYDWLKDGDLGNATVYELAAEWRNYDSAEAE